MTELFVTAFISLDGVVDSPGGEEGYRHTGWTLDIEADPAVYQEKLRETLDTDALLLGRRTYDGFSAAWPEREGDFADKFNSMPKYVVSSTLTDPAWHNTRVIALDDVAALKRSGDHDRIQVAGSATLAKALHRAGLVDEYRLMVFPVVLGSGQRLWPDDADDKVKLHLDHHTTYANGVQLQVFRRA